MRRTLLAAGLLLAGLIVAGAIVKAVRDHHGPAAKPLPGAPLRELAQKRGWAFGTAVDDAALRDEPGYREVLGREFSSLTPENAMKWNAVEPERGKLQWGGADRAVAFAAAHDMVVRGHTLVWHNQLPAWLSGGHFGRAALRRIMRVHIRVEMGRYRGKIAQWDVANEVVGDDGKLRPSLWLDTLGPGFVADAYRVARSADPKAQLYLNEVGAETVGPKSDRLYRLARDLKAKGLLDGIGFQAHLSQSGVPPSFRQNLRRFAALGLKVAITEADVRVSEPASAAELSMQAQIYADLIKACRAVSACMSFTVWGFTDRHSWIPGSSPGYGSATLLDDELGPKPAYRAVVDALASR